MGAEDGGVTVVYWEDADLGLCRYQSSNLRHSQIQGRPSRVLSTAVAREMVTPVGVDVYFGGIDGTVYAFGMFKQPYKLIYAPATNVSLLQGRSMTARDRQKLAYALADAAFATALLDCTLFDRRLFGSRTRIEVKVIFRMSGGACVSAQKKVRSATAGGLTLMHFCVGSGIRIAGAMKFICPKSLKISSLVCFTVCFPSSNFNIWAKAFAKSSP